MAKKEKVEKKTVEPFWKRLFDLTLTETYSALAIIVGFQMSIMTDLWQGLPMSSNLFISVLLSVLGIFLYFLLPLFCALFALICVVNLLKLGFARITTRPLIFFLNIFLVWPALLSAIYMAFIFSGAVILLSGMIIAVGKYYLS